MKRNLLICVTGLTPQIVTETLFCLSYKEKIPIDEIYVLTTKRGKEVILGRDKHPSTPKTPLKEEIYNLCKKYKFKEPLFEENDTHIIVAKEETIELPDVRSDKDNILFPNRICEFLRMKSSDPENVLYCSITGGRKSMSVHLANALSIFARENDRLLHVLTKEEHEFKGFYPKTRKEINDLELADIPFVRLRPIISAELKKPELLKVNFEEIVKFTQKQLKLLTPSNKMIIDIERRELRFCNDLIVLEPMEFLFYYFFVDSKLRGNVNITIADFTSNQTRDKFIEYFTEFFPNHYIKEKRWFTKGFDEMYFLQRKSKINRKIENLIPDPDFSDLYKINVNRKYSESTYFIKADSNRFIIK